MKKVPNMPLVLLLTLLTAAATCAAAAEAAKPHSPMSYLDNGVIRLGVNLDIGGSITYLADAKKKVNVVNNHDWGRQIQMSFYSGPNPFTPGGKQPNKHWVFLGWNPIQSGDVYGFRSKVIEYRNDGKSIYVKCTPMHWPLRNQPGRCTFELWISLKDNAAHVRSRITNRRDDKTQYPARGQELPAVYTNGPLYRLTSYTGDKPFTGGAVQYIIKKGATQGLFPWKSYNATENWSALLDDNDWGLGIRHDGVYRVKGGFSGKPGKGGPKDAPTGYIAPIHREILDHNIRYEYSYVLILGTLKEIRRYVYDHAKRPGPPHYSFIQDRRHWTYRNARDAGWPVKGCLHVMLEGKGPQMTGPPGFWQAKDAPKLYIRAAYRTKHTSAAVFWKTHAENRFTRQKSVTFRIKPDGRYHTYEVDLGSSAHYKGAITGLRFDPAPAGAKGDYVKVKLISFRKPAAERNAEK